MDLFAAENFNDFLAKLAQANAGASQPGVGGNQAEDVSLRRWGVPAQQQIRRAQMKEAQRMALNKLTQIHQASQLLGGRRDANGHDRVSGFSRSQQMTDRANAT